MVDTTKKQSKKCEYCGNIFYRDPEKTDYSWSIKRFCCYMCNTRWGNEKDKKRK